MNMSIALSMTAFALAASISPGPVNVVCLSSGTRYGLGAGLVFATGASVGFVMLFLGVGFGLNSLLERVPLLGDVIRWGGIAFLLYLSYRLATASGEIENATELKPPGFVTGAVMQWLNPKAWLAAASGIGAYTAGAQIELVLLFALIYAPVCWLSLGFWVYAGAFLKRYVQRPAVLRGVNLVLAALLVVSCLLLVFE